VIRVSRKELENVGSSSGGEFSCLFIEKNVFCVLSKKFNGECVECVSVVTILRRICLVKVEDDD
jgi:hypothetical protein